MSNLLNNRRGGVPKPAVCKSKATIVSNLPKGFAIPTTLTLFMVVSPNPSGPPYTGRQSIITLTRWKYTLTYRGEGFPAGYAVKCQATINPIKLAVICDYSIEVVPPYSPVGPVEAPTVTAKITTFNPGLATGQAFLPLVPVWSSSFAITW